MTDVAKLVPFFATTTVLGVTSMFCFAAAQLIGDSAAQLVGTRMRLAAIFGISSAWSLAVFYGATWYFAYMPTVIPEVPVFPRLFFWSALAAAIVWGGASYSWLSLKKDKIPLVRFYAWTGMITGSLCLALGLW